MANAKTFWPNSLEARELDRLEDILYLAMDPSCVIMNPRVNDGSPLAFPYMALNLLEKYFQEEAKRVEKYLSKDVNVRTSPKRGLGTVGERVRKAVEQDKAVGKKGKGGSASPRKKSQRKSRKGRKGRKAKRKGTKDKKSTSSSSSSSPPLSGKEKSQLVQKREGKQKKAEMLKISHHLEWWRRTAKFHSASRDLYQRSAELAATTSNKERKE